MPTRLRGSHSPNMGRIEVHYAGKWGAVHALGWDSKDATVAGRHLEYNSASLSCKPSREASIKRVGEEGTLGSFPPLPLPLISLLSLPSLSSFPSSSSPFLCLPRCLIFVTDVAVLNIETIKLVFNTEEEADKVCRKVQRTFDNAVWKLPAVSYFNTKTNLSALNYAQDFGTI